MTPDLIRKLAEKILRKHCTGVDTYEDALEAVESTLHKVADESWQMGFESNASVTRGLIEIAKTQGWNSAIEKAAEWIDQYATGKDVTRLVKDGDMEHIANQIRALKLREQGETNG